MPGTISFSDEELEMMAKKFKTLSESSRLKILRALSQEEKCVNEIIEATGLLQANVSKQLKILMTENIVQCRAAGLQRYYKITDFTVLSICSLICSGSHPVEMEK